MAAKVKFRELEITAQMPHDFLKIKVTFAMLPFGRLTNAPCAVLGIDKNVPRCFASSEARARLGKKEAQSHSWNTTDELATKTVPEISSLHATGCLQFLP